MTQTNLTFDGGSLAYYAFDGGSLGFDGGSFAYFGETASDWPGPANRRRSSRRPLPARQLYE
jgi:hypothetical protein